jgi:hypothetical protein
MSIVWYANHHRWMKRMKAPKPTACESCGSGRKIGLSLIGRGTRWLKSYDGPRLQAWPSAQTGRITLMRVSDDPGDYLWECQSCNNGRRQGRAQ